MTKSSDRDRSKQLDLQLPTGGSQRAHEGGTKNVVPFIDAQIRDIRRDAIDHVIKGGIFVPPKSTVVK
jgi:hypothetical protein